MESSETWNDYLTDGARCLQDGAFAESSQEEVEALILEALGGVYELYPDFDPFAPGVTSAPEGYGQALARVQQIELGLAREMYDCNFHPIQQRAMFKQLLEELVLQSPN